MLEVEKKNTLDKGKIDGKHILVSEPEVLSDLPSVAPMKRMASFQMYRLGSVQSELFSSKTWKDFIYDSLVYLYDKHGRALSFSVLFLVLALIMLPFRNIEILEVPAWRFFFAICSSIVLILLCYAAEAVFLTVFQLLDNTFLWPVWFHISSTKDYVAPLAIWIVLLNYWDLWVDKQDVSDALKDSFITVNGFENILRCLIIVQVVFIVRQIVLNIVFWEVESKDYIDRIAIVEKNGMILQTLCRRRDDIDKLSPVLSNVDEDGFLGLPGKSGAEITREFSALSSLQTSGKSKVNASKVLMDTVGDKNQKSTGFFRISSMFRWNSTDLLLGATNTLSTEEEIRFFSDRLFNSLTQNLGRNFLELSDFRRFFEKDVAEEAFLQFIREENQNTFTLNDFTTEECHISRVKFQEALLRMRKARLDLVSDLQGSASASSVISHLLSGLSYISIPFIFAVQFGASTGNIILTTSTLTLSLAFALGTVISRLVESLYFIFVTKPYKVGDVVLLGSPLADAFTVLEIKMMTTTFRTITGKLVIVPNYVISSQMLLNHNGLPNAVVKLSFRISLDTPSSTMDKIEASIKSYLAKNVSDWLPSSFKLMYFALEAMSGLDIDIWVTHRKKWQEGKAVWTARSALVNFLRFEFRKHGIEYQSPPNRVILESKLEDSKRVF